MEETQLGKLLPGHVWIRTSGSSTGAGKWLALSHRALEISARAVNEHLKVDQDLWMNVLPVEHVGGMGILVRARVGKCAILDRSARKWNPKEFTADLESYGITLCSLVPTQVFDLVKENLKSPKKLRAIIVGGGSLAPDLYLSARKLGWPLLPSYGLSECASSVATADLSSLDKLEYPKLKILNHVKVRVSNGLFELASDSLLTAYATQVDGKWQLVDPRKNGWFTTEDRGEIDGGFLQPLGRQDRQVKIMGKLVNLPKLESQLTSLMMQLEFGGAAALLTHPDARNENRLVIVVSGVDLPLAEKLFDTYNNHVPGFERATNLYCVSEIPLSTLGKPLVPLLREQLGL